MGRSGVCLLVACMAFACGDGVREPPPRPPGTWVLDVDHWLASATPLAAGSRWADRANQATGADPSPRPSRR